MSAAKEEEVRRSERGSLTSKEEKWKIRKCLMGKKRVRGKSPLRNANLRNFYIIIGKKLVLDILRQKIVKMHKRFFSQFLLCSFNKMPTGQNIHKFKKPT